MKKLTRTMKCVAWMLSLCLLFGASVVSEAAKYRQYQPGTTYVNPAVNSKDEYYSVTKMRMETYSTTSFEVVYPKDATLEVTTNKPKKLQAMITRNTNELPGQIEGKKVYITPTKIHYSYKEYVPYPVAPAGAKLIFDEECNQYYYEGTVIDPETQKQANARFYLLTSEVQLDNAVDPTYIPSNSTQYEETNVYLEESTGLFYYYSDHIKVEKTFIYDDEIESNWEKLKVYLTDAPDVSEFDYAESTDATNMTRRAYNKDAYGYYTYEYLYDSELESSSYYSNQAEKYDDGSRYEYAKATVQLDSTKAGTYKVNVIVNGVKTTLKVYVTPYGNEVFTKMKLGDDTINSVKINSSKKNYSRQNVSNYKIKSSLESAKLKLTANKGMKITGIVVASVNEKGNVVMKKYKNGKTIKLSQGYAAESHSAWNEGNKCKDSKKYTYVCVSYKDKYTKTSVKYSIVKKHGKKQIKEVRKEADGKNRVSYYDYGETGFALWSY